MHVLLLAITLFFHQQFVTGITYQMAIDVDGMIAFNNVLSRDRPIVPKHFLFGNRKEQILHTRYRTNCSVLNHDVYMENTIDSPLCRCNSKICLSQLSEL